MKLSKICFKIIIFWVVISCNSPLSKNSVKNNMLKELMPIYNCIVNEDHQRLQEYFDEKVYVAEGEFRYGTFTKDNAYGGYMQKSGALYDSLYNTENLRKNYRGGLTKFYSIYDVFRMNTNIQSKKDHSYFVISVVFEKTIYTLNFKKTKTKDIVLTHINILHLPMFDNLK